MGRTKAQIQAAQRQARRTVNLAISGKGICRTIAYFGDFHAIKAFAKNLLEQREAKAPQKPADK